jgi:Subtilase family
MPTFRPRLILTFCLLTLALLTLTPLLTATPAHAEEVFTSQAAAAHATDSTWIPAPTTRAALCLVDTGVTPNPDTTNVIARFSIDNGTPDDLSPDHHGTLMSMIASAPFNGFGMVGAAPSINVVSVRASRDGRTFGAPDVTAAIQLCVNKREAFRIKAISLSLGGGAVRELDAMNMALAEDAVDLAERADMVVAAAAGNHEGAVDWPAAYTGVLAVGAAEANGRRCAFSASGPEVDIWAPGCPLDVAASDGVAAWASGTSESTALVAASIVQMRQTEARLDAGEASDLVKKAARESAAGPYLDVAAAFRSAGRADALELGRLATPSPVNALLEDGPPVNPANLTKTPPVPLEVKGDVAPKVDTKPRVAAFVTAPSIRMLPRPLARAARFRHSLFTATLKNREPRTDVRVAVFAHRRGRRFPQLVRTVRVRTSRLRIRVEGTISEVAITYCDRAGAVDASPPLVLRR